jgi:RNA polymerase sigma factor (sigma-70 family)
MMTAYATTSPEPGRTPDDLIVTDLVTRAAHRDMRAWDALIERYTPLIRSICRRHRLADTDADDVAQSTWLHLVGQLANIRHPAALPGWIATTAKRECLRVLRSTTGPLAGTSLDTEIPDQHAASADAALLAAERHAALREALAALPPVGQQLMTMLTADPPLPYTEISARLGIPVGSIGPNRQRCMDKLRRYPAIVALINADAGPGRRTVQLTH